MGQNQYRDLFLTEAREILNRLNTALVTLEKGPGDSGCLGEIFRQAHTLKGMAGTMGYETIAGLTHEMEGVLDLLRQGRMKADKTTVTLLFDSLDSLEKLVEAVATCKTEPQRQENKVSHQADSVGKKLQEMRSRFKGPDKVQEERRSNLRLEASDRDEIIQAAQKGIAAYRVTVTLTRDCKIKEARAYMIAKVLSEMGKIIRADHIYKQLEQGKFGRHFGLFYLSEIETSAVQKKIEEIPETEKIILAALTPDEVRPCVNAGEGSGVRPGGDKKVEASPSSGHPHIEEEGVPKDKDAAVPMLRVSLDRLDRLMNLVGELAINKIRLGQIAKELQQKSLSESVTLMERLSDELQNEMMRVRLVPMEFIFNRYPRMIRDLAAAENKAIDLVIEGAEIGLDRTILDRINEPLVHLLRNAVDHGIETTEERKKHGKNARGTLRLCARRERNYVVVEVGDDGAGMDADEIKKTAVSKKLIGSEEAKALRIEDVYGLITLPGFSTSKVVTQVAGRGVGMDVVKKTMESFGGSLEIQSTKGEGSVFILKLPLSLAIVQALLVAVGSETYAIPLVNVTEVIKIQAAKIRTMEHHEVIAYREGVLPLVRLNTKLGFGTPHGCEKPQLPVVVVEMGARRAGLVVDHLRTQQEIVIKMLEGGIRGLKGVTGATILGDGRVAMILDVGSML